MSIKIVLIEQEHKEKILLKEFGVIREVPVGGEVNSVFGRKGHVVAVEEDYSAFYASMVHNHAIEEVDGLQDALDNKAPLMHTHVKGDITDFNESDYATAVHTHVEGDITDLDKYTQAEVDAIALTKSDVGHSHVKGDITDFNESDYATAVHTHVEGDITDLDKYTQAEVDNLIATTGKVQSVFGRDGDIVALEEDYDEFYATTVHTHVEGDISDLDKYTTQEVDDALALKADSVHNHAIEDVTDLQTTLDEKAGVVHTHVKGDITDFVEEDYATAVHNHAIEDVTDLQTTLDEKARWRGAWQSTTYLTNDIAREGDYLGIANKETTDHIAPQNSEPDYELPSSPTYTTQTFDGLVISSHVYTFNQDAVINEVFVNIPVVNPNTQYRYAARDITDPDNIINMVIDRVVVSENEWVGLSVDKFNAYSGHQLRVELQALTSSGTTPLDGIWTYGGTSQSDAPSTGNWNTNNQNTILRIDKSDDTGDRSAELLAIVAGTTMKFTDNGLDTNFIEYDIESTPTDGGSYVEFKVDIISSSGGIANNTVTTLESEIPITTGTLYHEEVDHFLNNTYPAAVSVEGALSVGGGEFVPTNNAFGVKLDIQPVTSSSDWDIMAVTGSSTSGSGGGSDTVLSVFGRVGSISAESTDYDEFYAATVHEHVEADITDLDKYTQAEVDTKDAALQLSIDAKAISNLADVDLTELSGGQQLVFDAETGTWMPKFDLSGLGIVRMDYRMSTQIDDPTPLSGRVSQNNQDASLTTVLFFHKESRNGNDNSFFFDEMKENDWINIFDRDQFDDATRYDVTGAAVLNGDIWEVPVSFYNETGVGVTSGERVTALWRIGGSATYVNSVDGRVGDVTLGDLYATAVHNHAIEDVTDLQTTLDGKQDINLNYTLPSLDGTANQILVTDGLGSVSWQEKPDSGGGLTVVQDDIAPVLGGDLSLNDFKLIASGTDDDFTGKGLLEFRDRPSGVGSRQTGLLIHSRPNDTSEPDTHIEVGLEFRNDTDWLGGIYTTKNDRMNIYSDGGITLNAQGSIKLDANGSDFKVFNVGGVDIAANNALNISAVEDIYIGADDGIGIESQTWMDIVAQSDIGINANDSNISLSGNDIALESTGLIQLISDGGVNITGSWFPVGPGLTNQVLTCLTDDGDLHWADPPSSGGGTVYASFTYISDDANAIEIPADSDIDTSIAVGYATDQMNGVGLVGSWFDILTDGHFKIEFTGVFEGELSLIISGSTRRTTRILQPNSRGYILDSVQLSFGDYVTIHNSTSNSVYISDYTFTINRIGD